MDLRLSQFTGIQPRSDPEILPITGAQVAVNCRLWSGKLDVYPAPVNIQAVTTSDVSLYRLDTTAGSFWLTFTSDTDIVPSQLAGDATGRLFFTTASGQPQMTNASMALIGNTTLNPYDNTVYAAPHAFYVNQKIGTGIFATVAVGDYLNASLQVSSTDSNLVNGYVAIYFYDASSVQISFVYGSFVQGGGQFGVSIISGAQVPVGTAGITVECALTSGTNVYCQFLHVTKGQFSAGQYPVASINLGLPAPPAIDKTQLSVPNGNITAGYTSYGTAGLSFGGGSGSTTSSPAITIVADGADGGVKALVAAGGYLTPAAGTNYDGDITATLYADGAAVDTYSYALVVSGGQEGAPQRWKFSTELAFTTPTAGSHAYTVGIGSTTGVPISYAHATCYFSLKSSVDLALPIWVKSTVFAPGTTLIDTNKNIQISIGLDTSTNITGATMPVWSVNAGDLTTDGTVTWSNMGPIVADQNTIVLSKATGIAAWPLMWDGGPYSISSVGTVAYNYVRVNGINLADYLAYAGSVDFVVSVTKLAEGNAEDRVYTITYVADLDGEEFEGPPGPATPLIAVNSGQAVLLKGFPTPPAGFDIVAIRIYRTITDSTGTTVWTFVTQISTTTTQYFDAFTDIELSGTLPSDGYTAPPTDMRGLIATPNGIFAGFDFNTLYLSPAYQPQAYPVGYQQSVEYKIVSVQPFGQSIAILTDGKPYIITGTDPSQMSMQRIETSAPCFSKQGVVDMGYAVLYPSSSGIMAVSTQGAQLVSIALWTPDQWSALNPASMIAGRWHGKYVCAYVNTSSQNGIFIFDPSEPEESLVNINLGGGTVYAMWTDPATGQLFINYNGEIMQFKDTGAAMTYTWQSRNFVMERELSFGAMRVRAAAYPVTITLYADGVAQTPISVANSSLVRLPSGFLAQVWSFGVSGSVRVDEVVIGETVADIKKGVSQYTQFAKPYG